MRKASYQTKASHALEIKRLKMVMLAQGLNSKALARSSHVNVRVVQNILSGNDLSWPARVKINRALGVDVFFNPSLDPKTKNPKTP